MNKKNFKIFLLLFASLFLLIFPSIKILAENMQSGNYRITSDTVNFGGQDSGSTNYKLRDTLGEAATGPSASANYKLFAGFWQMQESYISISAPTNLALTPIGGINGGASEGTISWQVLTDNLAGYSMSIATTSTPALTSAYDSFADYAPVGADPDYNFTILPIASAFGFAREGDDVSARFKNNGAVCNTGTNVTVDKCWDGLSTTPKTVALRTTSNHPTGSTVTVRFRAETGANHIQKAGSYSAPIVVTAITL